MTGRWNKHKTKKPLETSLGQAPKEAEKAVDVAHLRKPLNTSIVGLKQVLNLFQTATTEVQDYISYECDVLYECRVCRTIFRSIANFILHKRSYCKEKYNNLAGPDTESTGGFVVDEKEEEKKSEEEIKSNSEKIDEKEESDNDIKKKAILPIIDKLIKKQEINILAKNTLNEDLSTKADNSDDDVVFISEENTVMLQKIDTSNVAVFQTSVKNPDVDNTEFMKSEVMEIHGILENNEAVIGSNGKVCNFETHKKIFKPNIPKQDLVCTECNFTFSTEKTLTHHIKYKHNKTCIVYPCPDCKETFANAWSVYRHLYKVHRRSSSQVRRMRALIHASGIRKDQEPERKKKDKGYVKENEENQWMNNFERDKDLQMCGGCGKRFERKAALHSHSQMCTKRIAICNTIKENDMKMKIAENKKLEKVVKPNGVKVAKGSAKRKPALVYMHKVPSPVDNTGNDEKKNSEENKVDCPNSEEVDSKKSDNNDSEKVDNKSTTLDSGLVKVKHSINLSSSDWTKIKKRKAQKEKVAEVISDSEEEKENPSALSIDKEIKNDLGGDVVITRYKDNQKEEKPQKDTVPEIEIFTISDDSCDSEKPESTTNPSEENKNLKRKRAASLDFDNKASTMAAEFKEYLNDDLDQCFFINAVPHMDKNIMKCVPCKSKFLSQYQLLQHMSLHFSWFRFQCCKCSFMSFYKYDCTTHAFSSHGTPNNLINSTVLPIPKWKVLCGAHNFIELNKEKVNNNELEPLTIISTQIQRNIEEGGKKMPQLEAVPEAVDKDDDNNMKEVSEDDMQTSSETIVLEDDEMPDICNENAQSSDTVILSDEELREQKESKMKAGPSKVKESVASNRPVRNRTKSVKTVQNDFIYDLAKVLKLNDNSIKGGKVKKAFGKS